MCRGTGEGSFDPAIVKKRQRRLEGIDGIILSLSARGLTTGEISAHFAEVYGASVSKDTISRITDKVIEEMTEWRNRPLDRVYPVVFIDAINVKIRDGQVSNRPVHAAVGVSCGGERDILGLWAGDGGEGAKFWLAVLTDLKNRGVEDVRRIICTTNAIENLNSRYRRVVRIRGHFPTEQSAMKCLYLVTRSLDPTGRGRARWVARWKPALNAFAVTFEGRIDPSRVARGNCTPGLPRNGA